MSKYIGRSRSSLVTVRKDGVDGNEQIRRCYPDYYNVTVRKDGVDGNSDDGLNAETALVTVRKDGVDGNSGTTL